MMLKVVPTGAPPPTDEVLPHSIEAEQQVLGALLTTPGLLGTLPHIEPDDWFDPVHAEIYRVIAEQAQAGRVTSPVSLKPLLMYHEGLKELGGPAYLVKLGAAAISQFAAKDYVQILKDTRKRRDLMAAARAMLEALKSDKPVEAALSPMEGAMLKIEGRKGAQPVTMTASVTKTVQAVNAAYQGEELPLVRTGIPSLEKFVPGFGAGEFWLLAGRPGMGKTAFASTIALRAARAMTPVVFLSLEMVDEGITIRMVSSGTAGQPGRPAVPYNLARQGKLTEEQMRSFVAAAEEISFLPLTYLGPEYGNPEAFFFGVKKALAKLQHPGSPCEGRMPLLIVDYLQLMKAPPSRSIDRGRYDLITATSIALKETAMRLQCPVLGLAQLSRNVDYRDDKRPVLADLKESGQLEQDADGIIFTYRPEYYIAREEPDPSDFDAHAKWEVLMAAARNRADLIIAKQRQGSPGTAKVRVSVGLNHVWED